MIGGTTSFFLPPGGVEKEEKDRWRTRVDWTGTVEKARTGPRSGKKDGSLDGARSLEVQSCSLFFFFFFSSMQRLLDEEKVTEWVVVRVAAMQPTNQPTNCFQKR